jgi:hypothetical protein
MKPLQAAQLLMLAACATPAGSLWGGGAFMGWGSGGMLWWVVGKLLG